MVGNAGAVLTDGFTASRFTFFLDGPLSQWHPSPFTLNGVGYLCAEQSMMHAKALLFADTEIADAILATPFPYEHKRLGREVRNYREETWARVRHAVVYAGTVAKFTQNADLLGFLLATGDGRIVEASPFDRIWGIGLTADDPRAQKPEQWRGLNLLGDILTEVRDALKRVRAT